MALSNEAPSRPAGEQSHAQHLPPATPDPEVACGALSRDAIRDAVLSSVREVSAMNGHSVTVDEKTNPFTLPDFESITSIEVQVQIASKLGFKVARNPFEPVQGSLSLENVIDALYAARRKMT